MTTQAAVAGSTPAKRRLLQKRQTTADAFETSIDTIKRLERAGRLTPIRFFASANADVYHDAAQVAALKEALLAEVEALGVPAWLSMTCADGRTRAGEHAEEAFGMAAGIDEIIAVGVNCVDSVEAADLVSIAVESSRKPAVVYPNSGESWDAARRAWAGTSTFGPSHAAVWVATGARLVGGWCRVGPSAIRQLARSAPGWPVGDSGAVSSR